MGEDHSGEEPYMPAATISHLAGLSHASCQPQVVSAARTLRAPAHVGASQGKPRAL